MALFESLLQFLSTGTVLGALLLILVLYLLSSGSRSQKEGKEPPGPKPLPLLGNLLTLDLKRPFDTFCELSKTYGNIFQVFLGPRKTVVLVGYKTVKEALVNYPEEFGDRHVGPGFKITNDEHGILFSNGENWKEMRRFALSNLRDFGMGKRGSEDKIIEEIQYLKGEFDKFEGKAFDTTQPVNYAVSNIISSIVYGSRFEYTDPRFTEMVDRANENVRVGGSATMMLNNIFPWLGPLLNSRRIILRNVLKSRAEMTRLINGLLETLNPQDRRGFVDSFLIRKQSEEQSFKKDSYFHQENLFVTVGNLFVAGTDTTGTTLRWGLMLMAKYPHIQDRVQEEIDRVIGGRQPVVDDRKKLPYTDAVIHETQRLANIVPMSLPHKTSCDVHFNGYFIKKGTPVIPLLTSVLKDPSEWEKPNSFYPEHFLDEKGQFVKRDAFMPFSAGIVFSNGENWKEMRRFALSNLRDFGMGKRGSEDKIIEEIQYLKGEFDKFEGKAFDTTQPVNYAVSNIISSIVYGSRFEYTDPRFTEMVDRANENVRVGGSISMWIHDVFPWLGPFLKNKRIIVENIVQSRVEMKKLINGLLETLNPQDRRGFVDSFLIRKQSDEKSGKKDSYFHDENLMMTVTNLFVAGTDTTGTTLRWGLMLMAKYPHIQDRVQDEIDRVIGGRQPVVEDRKKLPYTDAVIHETQRLANIVPLSLPHITTCDVHFNGYFIKKGTTVVPLLTSVLKDPSEWEKPNSFYPEHFLDEKGQFVKRDAFMPFSAAHFERTPPKTRARVLKHECLFTTGIRCVVLVDSLCRDSPQVIHNLQLLLLSPDKNIACGACGVWKVTGARSRTSLTRSVMAVIDKPEGQSAHVSHKERTLLGALLLILVLYSLSSGSRSQKEGKEPPGPKPLPLLGNLLTLDPKRPFDTFCELSKTYGNIFQVFYGPKKVLVLVGYKTVKQALVNYAEEFKARDIMPGFWIVSKGHGILFSNGENWKEMRRFALSNLRDFGMGKRGSEEKIIEEIQYLKGEFDKFEGKAFDTTQPVNYAVSNIISSIVYGTRFEYTDPRFTEMVDRANENVRIGGSISMWIYNVFPWLGLFLKDKRIFIENVVQCQMDMKKLINGLLETLNPQDLRGFVDSFLIRKQSDEKSGKKDSYFHQENLLVMVGNLFAAGTDTTGTTLRWGLMLMAKYPHIQDRVQEEIDRVIGGRQPLVDDRKKLPYTDAVIHETQRLANIVPMNLPHKTSCDVHFNGYFIKKGTTVVPLLTSVLKDPSEWEKPNSFYPEHFLDEKGQFVKRDAFMPFSAGRRVCLGESLARMELFLFFTSLLQSYRFTTPPGVSGDDLDLKGIVGITLNPSPHKLCVIRRS
ncbi:Cytochrome P450 2K1 [Anabarilius grahami]|uniref:Cytochrome P450 2K1 n=1 Tax=Anabarilius grahami TaxID=495550 RepID=A0A3N0XY88_ANAGA|nr:Cytochrome P450 2K1 [Anabarilius grahami]